MTFVTPNNLPEALAALEAMRAKNGQLIAEAKKARAQRDEARARVAALEARTFRGRLNGLMRRLGYVPAPPMADTEGLNTKIPGG